MYYGERVIVPRLNKRVGEITPIGLAIDSLQASVSVDIVS